jgi:hypothetical protein
VVKASSIARAYIRVWFLLLFFYIFYFGAEPLFLGLEAPSPKDFLWSVRRTESKTYVTEGMQDMFWKKNEEAVGVKFTI